MKTTIFLLIYVFVCEKDYRTMTSGVQGAPRFRRYGRELVSKPAISFKKCWGGYRRTTQVVKRTNTPLIP